METINIRANNRETLIRSIVSKLDSSSLEKLLRRDSNFKLLHIQREDCGCSFSYQTEIDIPSDNVTCEHGNKIIQYTD